MYNTCKLAGELTFCINDQIIAPTENVNILGLKIDNKLTFQDHVSEICQKAARQLNVLKRRHMMLDFDTKMAIFRSFILANFNYCPIIWHIYSIKQTRIMEKIQERALRFVYNDFKSPPDTLLHMVNHQMLYLGRLRSIAIETYKILHGQNPKKLKILYWIWNS